MDDNEDKLIRDAEFFIALRKKVPANSKNDLKITQIAECIKNGADVNIRFANDANNTPLHIAVIKGESDTVKILLEHGARIDLVNDAGKTALELAKMLPDRLNFIEIFAVAKEATGGEVKTTNSTKQTKKDATVTGINEYKKRPGTANVRGQLYETKLLTMIYFRALRCKEITQFYLGTNMDEVGDIDDVCLRFKTKKNDYIVFVQAKYKHEVAKGKIRYHDLWQATNDYSLLKCYVSYIEIRNKFNVNSPDEFFRGNYEDLKPHFVMYTTIKDDIKGIRKITRPVVDKMVDNLIRTGKPQNIFQFTSEDENVELIVNTLLKERMRSMGKRLLLFIQDGKYDMMLSDENICCFHVVLARKVFNVNAVNADGYRTGSFREDFFSTNDILLIELRETLYAEVEEQNSMSLDEMDVSLRIILLEPTEDNISVLIGSVVIYNSSDCSLKLVNEGTRLGPKYQSQLAALRVTESVINGAIGIAGRRKLENINGKLKFPVGFGNLDMTLNENKRDSRLDYITTKISDLIKNAQDKENIVIREGVFSPVKKQDLNMLNINGGIAGAVGNLLISGGENKLKFNLVAESMAKNAQGLLERLTERLGDLKIYKFCIEVECFPRLSLHGSEKEKRFARDFLNSLYFYTLQKKEEDLEETVTKELQKIECSNALSKAESYIKSNALFLKVHNEIQNWWLLEKSAKYLTNNMKEFDKIFRELQRKGLLTFLNYIYLNEMYNTSLEFTSEALDVLDACKTDTRNATLIIVHTDVHVLSCHKLVQYCKDAENYIFIDIDYVCKVSPHCLQMIFAELSETDIHNVVIVCEDITKYNLNDIISVCRAGKLILVTSTFTETEGCVYVRDDRINLTDLTDASQVKVLESKFTFQGFEVTFAEVFDETTKYYINAKILQKIIKQEQITIGQSLELSTFADIKEYYVPRTLKYNEELSGGDENLDDYTNMRMTAYDEYTESSRVFLPSTLIDHRDLFKDRCQKQPYDVVLLLDGPGMGKSTLLTHLSLETKRMFPKIWIQRINLLDHTTQFHEWHDKGIEIDKTVAFNFLSTVGLSKEMVGSYDWSLNCNLDLEFVYKKDAKIDDCKEKDALLTFELNVFLQCFKEGRVIFLFDGFDEICPIYKQEVTQLLKCFSRRSEIEKAKIDEKNPQQLCVWITSRPYNDLREMLEDEFGTSYTLLPFSYKDISLFIDKYMKRNLTLNSLTNKQLKNVDSFFEYMKTLKTTGNNSLDGLKATNISLHSIYVAALKYFESVIQRTHLNDRLLQYVKEWEMQVNKDFSREYLNMNDAFTLSGVPLHVYLAVNYFHSQIKDTTSINTDVKKRWDLDTNAFAFYEGFLETKLKTIWFKEKNNMDIYKPGVIAIYEKEKKEFIETHKKLAFFAVLQKQFLTVEEKEDIENIIKKMEFGENQTGLIDRIVNGVPKFVHYTFAEYFTVERIIDFLKSGVWEHQRRMIDLILNQILAWGMTGILIILDMKIKLDPGITEVFTDPKLKNLIFRYIMDQHKMINASDYLDEAQEIFGDFATPYLDKVVHMNLKHLMEFLLDTLMDSVNKKNLDDFLDLIEYGYYIDKLFHHEYYEYGLKIVECVREVDETKVHLLNRK